MGVLKYNNIELNYDDTIRDLKKGWEKFINSKAFYGTPKPDGTYKRKYEQRRQEDGEALNNVLEWIRQGLQTGDVIITDDGITVNNGSPIANESPNHRRATYYIAKTLMDSPATQKKKITQAGLTKELQDLVGNTEGLNNTYLQKAYIDAINTLMGKYKWNNPSMYDLEEGFDLNSYQQKLQAAIKALQSPDTADDAYYIGNQLGLTLAKPKVASNYDLEANKFISELTALGLSRDAAEEIYNTKIREVLIQKKVNDYLAQVAPTDAAKASTDKKAASPTDTAAKASTNTDKKPADNKQTNTDNTNKNSTTKYTINVNKPELQPGAWYKSDTNNDFLLWNGQRFVAHRQLPEGKSALALPHVKPVKAGSSQKKDESNTSTRYQKRSAKNGAKLDYLRKFQDGGKSTEDKVRDNVNTGIGISSIASMLPGRWGRAARYLTSLGFGTQAALDMPTVFNSNASGEDRAVATSRMFGNLVGVATAAPTRRFSAETQTAYKEAQSAAKNAAKTKTDAQKFIADSKNKKKYDDAVAKRDKGETLSEAEQKTITKFEEQKKFADTDLTQVNSNLADAKKAREVIWDDSPNWKKALAGAGVYGATVGVLPYLLNYKVDAGDMIAGTMGTLLPAWLGPKFANSGIIFPAAGIAGLSLLPSSTAQAQTLQTPSLMHTLYGKKAGDTVKDQSGNERTLQGFATDDNGIVHAVDTEGNKLTAMLPEVTVTGTKPSWMPQFEVNPNYNPGEIRPANTSFWYTNPVSRYVREAIGQIANNQPLNGKFVWPYIVPIAVGTSALASGLSSIGSAIAGTAAGTKGLQLLKSLRDANWVATPSNLQTTTSSYAGITPQDAIINQIKQKGNK